MTAGEAENAFLLLASQQGMYGLDIHLAEVATLSFLAHSFALPFDLDCLLQNTRAGSSMLVGVGAQGLALFTLETVSFAPFDTIRWQTIRSTKFRGKNFYVYPVSFDSSRPVGPAPALLTARKSRLSSGADLGATANVCLYPLFFAHNYVITVLTTVLWKSVVRHHAFFRVKKVPIRPLLALFWPQSVP